jgi:hypothetical protein
MKTKQKPESMFKLTVRLPHDLARRLKLYAAETGSSAQAITTEALEAKLPRTVNVQVRYGKPKSFVIKTVEVKP